MLTQFKVEGNYYGVRIKLDVDCQHQEVSTTTTYQGRIVELCKVFFEDVSTPEKADKWISDRIEAVYHTIIYNRNGGKV